MRRPARAVGQPAMGTEWLWTETDRSGTCTIAAKRIESSPCARLSAEPKKNLCEIAAVILVIDNYDSFTYNLVQAIGGLGYGSRINVVRNDRTSLDEIESWGPAYIVISPGPCTPNEAGISCDVIRRFAGRAPILGVCLGHQCIGQAFGAKVVRAGRLMHGKTSPIHHRGTGIYAGLSNPFAATRYHSLTVDESTIPPDFEVTAWTDRRELMGIRHKTMSVEGVQFHPESYLTAEGHRLIANFLRS